ncbi:MAG: hypothetical protein JO217_11800, partial [Acidobacteriaceae bacterium]|nr:hypothetical protein [Acidobacteriaceae bacterium]
MWGYRCGPVNSSGATCAALNAMAGAGWSPLIITVPTGQDLTINLRNNLPAPVPTSLVIMGQLGGGLGDSTQRTTTPSPNHDNQGTTWPIANSGSVFTPPTQQGRVQSFATEVANGAMTSLTWHSPRPGTYLIESGTHPSIQAPMGLYGILVVTSAPSGTTVGTAYPNVTYNAEVPLLLSEIDPVQNNVVAKAVSTPGFSESATYGPYVGGPVMSINLSSPGEGYTSAPTITFSGEGSGAAATAVVDTTAGSPTQGQITAINIISGGTYTTAPNVTISGGGGSGAAAIAALQLQPNAISHCSGGAAACYPPVVNYKPLYYLFNGVGFNKTNASASLFPATHGSATGPVTGSVLVRFVNAGLRMHVPSIVGSQTTPLGSAPSSAVAGFSLIAEDGNPLPGVPRVQSEVFMAAGKTYDVMINVPAAGGSALPVFDRQLSLSANATGRDAGMPAYIGVNGAGLPQAGAIGTAQANPDTYNSIIPGQTFVVSDVSKGVIANDVNVYGVAVQNAPTKGMLTLNANGTFTYVASANWSGGDSFSYCANGSATLCTNVTLGPATIEGASGIIVANDSYTANVATALSIRAPGVLVNDKDNAGYPLKVSHKSITAQAGLTVAVDDFGGFNASVTSPGTYVFAYAAVNSQGTTSNGGAACNLANPGPGCAVVTLNFPTANGPAIQLVDGSTKTLLTNLDYRWVLEEDRT